MPVSFRMIACLALVACHPREGSPPSTPRAPPLEVWVDGAGPEGGDGSRARPFRSLGEALARRVGGAGLQVHLAPGRYLGPLVLPAGGEVLGEGAVVIGEGTRTVVTAREGARLRGVTIEGGGWGLEAGGTVRLESVRFSGQGEGAVRMGAGELAVTGGRFEAAGFKAVGLKVEGASARLCESTFQGTFRRAVEARDSRLEWESVQVSGARTALHQSGALARLTHVTVAAAGAGGEVGLFLHHGALELEDVTVTGHEYGLQTREATLRASGFRARGATRTGVSLLATTGRMESSGVMGSGDFGAVSLLGSHMVLSDFTVEGADGYGISATRGELRLERVSISGVTSREGDTGDGLHLRDVEVKARALSVRDVAGIGILAAQGARVTLDGGTLTGCRTAGVWVETLARVTSTGLGIHGSQGPALVALDNGVLRVEDLTAERNAGGLVEARCTGDTRVTLGRVRGQTAGAPAGPCVTGPSP